MRIDIVTITGPACVTAEDGEVVFQQLVGGLERGEVVELCFLGTEVYSTPFFNAAIGSLMRDYEVDDLNRMIRVLDLPPEGDTVLRRVIKNARDYFHDSGTRAVVDRALADPSSWS